VKTRNAIGDCTQRILAQDAGDLVPAHRETFKAMEDLVLAYPRSLLAHGKLPTAVV
jgi:hypothetical protein